MGKNWQKNPKKRQSVAPGERHSVGATLGATVPHRV
jgi:hypothetical protein